MAVTSTVRSTLFIAACFLAFAITACDNPPAQKKQPDTKVVSKKITEEKSGNSETETKSAQKKSPAPSKEKIDEKEEKKDRSGSETDKAQKPDKDETIRVSQSLPAYSAAGKINPFKPLIRVGKAEQEKDKKPERQLTPLEKIDLSQLQLVAVVQSTGDGDDFGMVQEADGKGYIVQKGTYIGTNSGIVTGIEPDRIIIEESFTDLRGNKKSRRKEMKLQKQDNKE